MIKVILFLVIVSLCINLYNIYNYKTYNSEYFKDCTSCPSDTLCWGKLVDIASNYESPYPNVPTYININNTQVIKFRYDNLNNIFYITYQNEPNKEYSVKKLGNTICMSTGILYDTSKNYIYGWHEYNNNLDIYSIDQNIIGNIKNFMLDPNDFNRDDYIPIVDPNINIVFNNLISTLSKS